MISSIAPTDTTRAIAKISIIVFLELIRICISAEISIKPDNGMTTLPEIEPQAVHHQNPFVSMSESHYDHVHHSHDRNSSGIESISPHLEGNQADNVSTSHTVFLSKTSTLDCKVYDIGEEQVSWMRQVGDILRLLSYDKNIYAANDRYELKVESGTNWKGWKLIIKNTELSDRGLYRCQVATKPTLVLDILLNVTEPETRITDDRETDVVEKHYNSGSMIELKCLVDKVPEPSDPITWKKGLDILSFNTSRGGISQKQDIPGGRITSKLYIVKASPRDSGFYSCSYGNLSSDIVTVHVIAGENSAAMQHETLSEEISVATARQPTLLMISCLLSIYTLVSISSVSIFLLSFLKNINYDKTDNLNGNKLVYARKSVSSNLVNVKYSVGHCKR